MFPKQKSISILAPSSCINELKNLKSSFTAEIVLEWTQLSGAGKKDRLTEVKQEGDNIRYLFVSKKVYSPRAGPVESLNWLAGGD